MSTGAELAIILIPYAILLGGAILGILLSGM